MPVVAGIMSHSKLILSVRLQFYFLSILFLYFPFPIPRPWINLLRQHSPARWTVQPNRFHGLLALSVRLPPLDRSVPALDQLRAPFVAPKTVWLRFETIPSPCLPHGWTRFGPFLFLSRSFFLFSRNFLIFLVVVTKLTARWPIGLFPPKALFFKR